MSNSEKDDSSVSVLLSELEYARTGISDSQKQVGKSFATFYIPILVVTGYALTQKKANPDFNVIFIGTPFLLFAYAGYTAYLNFIQRGFEIYRLKIEEALRGLIGKNPATDYQTTFVPEYYYGFKKWSVTGFVTFAFGIVTNIICISLVLWPSLRFGLPYLNAINQQWYYLWIVGLFVFGLVEFVAAGLMFSRTAHNIWQYK